MSREEILKALEDIFVDVENLAQYGEIDFEYQFEQSEEFKEKFYTELVKYPDILAVMDKFNEFAVTNKDLKYINRSAWYNKYYTFCKTDYPVSWEEILLDRMLEDSGIGKLELKEHKGGEDEGSNYYDVFYLPTHDLYIKVQGYYQSYNGVEYYQKWKCVTFAKPVEKTITVYENDIT